MYSFLRENQLKYKAKELKKQLLLSRFSKSEETKQKAKQQAFLMLARVILSKIDNLDTYYSNKYRNANLPVDKEDLANEAYVILDYCIERISVQKIDSFHFYYNKSLGRKLKDCFFQNGREIPSFHDIDPEYSDYALANYSNKQGVTQSHNFDDIYLKDLSETERLVVESKLNKETLQSFCERTGISSIKYYATLKKVKSKLSFLKDVQ